MSTKNNNMDSEEMEEILNDELSQDTNDSDGFESDTESKDNLNAIQDQLQNEKDKYLRLFAEFENYKKRTAKERMDLFKTAGQDVIISLLPVLDDFDRAIAEIKKTDDKNLLMGVQLIQNKLQETLKNKGLQDVEVKAGDVFNADTHEAITQIPAPTDKLKGKIIDVIEKGYALGDKTIRYPKVVIGQ